MSYADLWDRFGDVREFWMENRKTLEEFAIFLKEKSDLDRFYGKGLEKISKLPIFEKSFSSFCSFSPLIQGLKNFYTESSNNFLYQSDYIQEDLYTKIKKLILSHDSLIQEHKSIGKRLVFEREKLVKNHEKYRNRYWKTCKDNENIKANSKASQQEETHHKSYIHAINQLNSFNVVFSEGINKVLQIYQDQNIQKLKTLKQSLQVYMAGEASIIYSMKMHLDSLPVALDTFNPDIDQKMFIDSIFTGKLVEDSDFLPSAACINLEKSMFDFPNSADDSNFVRIVNNCWEGLVLSQEDLNFFNFAIKKDIGKKKLIMMLNEKRKNGQFKLQLENIKDLAKLFHLTLNCFHDVEHLSVAKQCIILSQTFFAFEANSEDKEKIFLQALISDHELWKKEDYWEFMVENAVDCSLDSLNEFGDEIDINEDLEIRKKSVISSAVISYAHIMNTFCVDRNRIVMIVEKTKARYGLNDEDLPVSYLF